MIRKAFNAVLLMLAAFGFVASFLIAAAGLFFVSESAQAADPEFRFAYVESKAPGRRIVITNEPCPAYGYVALIMDMNTEKRTLAGCWSGSDDKVLVSWEDGDVSEYPVSVFKGPR